MRKTFSLDNVTRKLVETFILKNEKKKKVWLQCMYLYAQKNTCITKIVTYLCKRALRGLYNVFVVLIVAFVVIDVIVVSYIFLALYNALLL